ncbi:MAG TPA: peptide MFS transporter [Rhizomicrobium sp.]|jgi:POT family proton-dependent oligopeptide transporter
MSRTDTVAVQDAEPQLFGHPLGLTFLFTTEMWERFSYYGMRAILVLYLTNFLLLSGQAEHVAGYATLKGIFESLVGRHLEVQPFSSLIYGTYTAFVYLTPFFGGIIADKYLGQRFSVIVGGVIMTIAELTLMVPSLFFLGLLFLIIGNGFFKPNISTQVGNLYKPGDSRIDRAYSIFYVGINVGAFLSPLICGSLGESIGYHWGFFAAGVGMLAGVFIYLAALRTLPPDRISRLKAKTEEKTKLTAQDWKAVLALVLLCIPTSLFWAVYEQQGNTISLWAQDFTDRRLIPGILNVEIPVTWFQAFNPFMIFAFTPLVVMLWTRQSKLGKEPSTVTKMALGDFMLGLSYLIMAAAAYLAGPTGHASWLWLLFFFVVITLGELYLSPIGLALVARVAPPSILSAMMGLWFITSFTGNLLQGYIGSFFSEMDKTHFFLLCAAIGGVAAAITWAFDRPLRSILEGQPQVSPVLTAEPQAEPHIEPVPGE